MPIVLDFLKSSWKAFVWFTTVVVIPATIWAVNLKQEIRSAQAEVRRLQVQVKEDKSSRDGQYTLVLTKLDDITEKLGEVRGELKRITR